MAYWAECKRVLVAVLASVLVACTGLPEGVAPVSDFDLARYAGTWYEVARLDHRFERGLIHVTAQYQVQKDGRVSVLNRGFDTAKGEWRSAQGVARFASDDELGYLEVSFFGPFYSTYVVFDMPRPYQLAYVAGYNKEFLWLLSRTPTVSAEVKQQFIERIDGLGFNANEIVWVEQDSALE